MTIPNKMTCKQNGSVEEPSDKAQDRKLKSGNRTLLIRTTPENKTNLKMVNLKKDKSEKKPYGKETPTSEKCQKLKNTKTKKQKQIWKATFEQGHLLTRNL